MGKVTVVGGKVGMEAPVNIPSRFADATWEQIIEACHTNTVPTTWVVGDQKSMTINGTSYAIDIIGKNHDDYADGSGKAPITFQMHDCYNTAYSMHSSNSNVWDFCDMRLKHLPAILALMPNEVQTAIKSVNKKTQYSGNSTSLVTTPEKLFLLSEIEIFGSTTYSYAGEGSQYAYYAAGNSKIKKPVGAYEMWWERSPSNLSSFSFCAVYGDGTKQQSSCRESFYVSFAFCF